MSFVRCKYSGSGGTTKSATADTTATQNPPVLDCSARRSRIRRIQTGEGPNQGGKNGTQNRKNVAAPSIAVSSGDRDSRTVPVAVRKPAGGSNGPTVRRRACLVCHSHQTREATTLTENAITEAVPTELFP